MSVLPLPLRTKLINASKEKVDARIAAIDAAVAWGKRYYPEYFIETQESVAAPFIPDYPAFKTPERTTLEVPSFIKKEV